MWSPQGQLLSNVRQVVRQDRHLSEGETVVVACGLRIFGEKSAAGDEKEVRSKLIKTQHGMPFRSFKRNC